MPDTTSASAFHQLLLDLEPRKADTDRVRPLANEIREKLRSSKQFGGVFRDILAGSVLRGTAIHPLHDVDVFLILDPAVHTPPERQRSPEGLLSRLSSTLDAEFRGRATVKPQHRSMNLRFLRDPVAFDVVPAFAHPSLNEVYWIPDLSRKDWIFTNPEKHHASLKAANHKAGSKLNQMIKLIKHWNTRTDAGFQSFYLEVMCYGAFDSGPTGFPSGFETLCRHLSVQVLQRCADPAGVGPRIDDSATPQVRQQRAMVFQDLARRAANAIALEKQQDLRGAHTAWREIFGSSWPG